MIDTAANPAEWLEQVLPRRFDRWSSDPSDGSWYTIDDLLDDGASLLHRWHARIMDAEPVPAPAAASYLAGWVGGTLAGAVGQALATTGAGFLPDRSVRWHQHPDGWIDRVQLGTPVVLVSEDHPWQGHHRVATADASEIGDRTIAALVSLLAPVIDACRGLGHVGRAGLWNEVADGFGLSVTDQPGIDPSPAVIDVVSAALAAPSAPWRATPTLRIVDAATGPVIIGQKGGCCLAYTGTWPAPDELDDGERLFYDAFPAGDGEPRYCTTCRFRDPADSERRQLFWIDRSRPS